jgi:hypothetical protein
MTCGYENQAFQANYTDANHFQFSIFNFQLTEACGDDGKLQFVKNNLVLLWFRSAKINIFNQKEEVHPNFLFLIKNFKK